MRKPQDDVDDLPPAEDPGIVQDRGRGEYSEDGTGSPGEVSGGSGSRSPDSDDDANDTENQGTPSAEGQDRDIPDPQELGPSVEVHTRPDEDTRPDQEIREDIQAYLAQREDIEGQNVEVQVSGGEVTVTGSVALPRAREVAEHVIRGVSGVKQVHNRLTVRQ